MVTATPAVPVANDDVPLVPMSIMTTVVRVAMALLDYYDARRLRQHDCRARTSRTPRHEEESRDHDDDDSP